LAGLTAALIATSSGPRPAIGAARSCAAPDLSHVSAQWHNASDLVLEGTLNVTNGGTRACLLPNPAQPDGKPSAALVDGSGKPVETTVAGGVIPVERLPPTQTLRLEPGQSGTAVIRWGGTYCGPPLTRVILRWTLANGDVLDRPVTGGVLTCIDTPYYGRGQSSAAISGFTLTTP
jgi:hypothetical protein